MDVLGAANLSEAAIVAILHHGLARSKYKHSQLRPEDRQGARPTGAIFLTRTKDDLREAIGFVATSQEAVLDNETCSHWTPNIFRFGTYADRRCHVLKGHSEDNLKQINTFVVDADFGSGKPSYDTALLNKFIVNQNDQQELWPTLVLETPHGYQAYYVLDRPVFVRRTGDQLPAVKAAKRVSEALRAAVAKDLPQVDVGANHFGFFRKPSEENVCFFEPALTHDFGDLQDWTKLQHLTFHHDNKAHYPVKQTDQPWFIALTHAQVPRGDGMLGRNNTLLTLCLAGYSSGWSAEDAYDFADQWNTDQREPLSDQEVRRIIRSAFSGKYQGASAAYIAELTATYTPDAPKTTGPKVWHKHAKPRTERKYSHLQEWAGDLVAYVVERAGQAVDQIKVTTRELRDQLGISSQVLTKVLAYVADYGLLKVVKQYGRHGGLYLTTRQMLGRQLQLDRRAQAISWHDFVTGQLRGQAQKEVVNGQVSLLPETLTRSGP